MNRRQCLKLITAVAGTTAIGALAACAPATPPATAPTQAPAKPAATSAPAAAAPPPPPPTPAGAPPAKPTFAAAAPAAAAKNTPQGTINVVQVGELRPVDPSVEIPSTTHLTLNVYDALILKDDDLSLKPHLAKSWSIEDNGLRIRLVLEDGVKFSNGDPLKPEDVVFTYQRVKDPKYKSFHTKYVTAVKEVKVVDPKTVDFILNEYDGTLLGRLALIGIASEKYVKDVGDDDFPYKPMGTGPYKVKEWVKGQQITLEANMDHFRGPPKIQTIIWKNVGEPATRAAIAQSGQADLIQQVSPTLKAQVESGGQATVASVHSLRTAWMVMNAYKKPYDDVRVRQALNHACNVDLWIDAILGKLAYRVAGMWGPAVFGYDPNVKPYEYNPDKAKQLLTEAGYPNGFETNLVFAPDGSVTSESELAQAVVADLAKVGIKVNLQPTEYNTTIAKYVTVYNADSELWIGSNANNTADADYNLTTNVYSKGRGPDRTGYYIPTPKEIDDAILQGRKIIDEKERLAHYQKLYKQIVDLAPMVFWFDLADSYGVSKKLDWKPRSDEVMSLRNAAYRG